MLKRTYLLSGIAVLTALGLMACGSSGSGQTEAKGSVSGNSETEAAANEESLNFTMHWWIIPSRIITREQKRLPSW